MVDDFSAPKPGCSTIHHLKECYLSFTAFLLCQPLEEHCFLFSVLQETELRGAPSSSTAKHLFMHLAHILLSLLVSCPHVCHSNLVFIVPDSVYCTHLTFRHSLLTFTFFSQARHPLHSAIQCICFYFPSMYAISVKSLTIAGYEETISQLGTIPSYVPVGRGLTRRTFQS